MSRRGFIGGVGALVGAGALLPASRMTAAKPSNATPNPIPGGITPVPGGPLFHVFIFGPGQEPATINDFNGFVGVADVQGTGTATNPDHSVETLLFDTDMRFMQGVYVGQDGAVHKGTFGFIWLDLYRGQYDFVNFSTQVHDFDPGINPYPNGLFWTVPLPDDSVDVQFGAGKASMKAENISAPDYFNIPNALFRFLPGFPIPATCSFDIRWSGPVTDRSNLNDPAVGFAGEFVLSHATMTFSVASSDGFRFVSGPSGTVSAFAQLGHMRNGVFYSG